MSVPFSSASKPVVIRLSSAGSPAGRPAMNPRSSSRPSALISAMLRPPSCEVSASGRSRVPWHTEQTRVMRKRCTRRRVRSLSLRSERSTAATALS